MRIFPSQSAVEKMFCVKDRETYVKEKEGWIIFGDFTLKIVGEMCSQTGGYLVASCATKVLGQLVERCVKMYYDISGINFINSLLNQFSLMY